MVINGFINQNMMKNKKILLLCGIPASGKSTWTNKFLRDNNNWVCISRDSYRFMMRNEPVLDPKGEKFVTELVEKAIVMAIKNKYNVIVDQTNVNLKYLNKMVEFCEKLADVEFKIFDIPLKTAMERDKIRERSVGDEVLKRMYKNYLDLFQCNFDFSTRKKKPFIAKNIKWKRNGNLPDAVIFDVDSTLAHMQGRRSPFDWKKVGLDSVDEKIREIVRVYKNSGYKIIVVTGRDGLSIKPTEDWLNENKIPFDYLYTKPENDFRKDVITKTEIYEEYIKGKFNILAVYDDRSVMCKKWRKLGLKCCQVMEGDF
jgi:predicted kinase